MYLVSKQLPIVMPVHQLQHCVAATLQGYMEMRHKRPTLSTILYQLVREHIRFQTTDSVALDSFHLVESLYQVDEALASCLAKIANVHTCQHNLLSTLFGSFLSLSHQRCNRRIP